MGRYYAMDRDNRWDRVEKAYAAMVYGEGEKAESGTQLTMLKTPMRLILTDEFVLPTVCAENANSKGNTIQYCIL